MQMTMKKSHMHFTALSLHSLSLSLSLHHFQSFFCSTISPITCIREYAGNTHISNSSFYHLHSLLFFTCVWFLARISSSLMQFILWGKCLPFFLFAVCCYYVCVFMCTCRHVCVHVDVNVFAYRVLMSSKENIFYFVVVAYLHGVAESVPVRMRKNRCGDHDLYYQSWSYIPQ